MSVLLLLLLVAICTEAHKLENLKLHQKQLEVSKRSELQTKTQHKFVITGTLLAYGGVRAAISAGIKVYRNKQVKEEVAELESRHEQLQDLLEKMRKQADYLAHQIGELAEGSEMYHGHDSYGSEIMDTARSGVKSDGEIALNVGVNAVVGLGLSALTAGVFDIVEDLADFDLDLYDGHSELGHIHAGADLLQSSIREAFAKSCPLQVCDIARQMLLATRDVAMYEFCKRVYTLFNLVKENEPGMLRRIDWRKHFEDFVCDIRDGDRVQKSLCYFKVVHPTDHSFNNIHGVDTKECDFPHITQLDYLRSSVNGAGVGDALCPQTGGRYHCPEADAPVCWIKSEGLPNSEEQDLLGLTCVSSAPRIYGVETTEVNDGKRIDLLNWDRVSDPLYVVGNIVRRPGMIWGYYYYILKYRLNLTIEFDRYFKNALYFW